MEQHIGDRLRERRRQLGLTQSELADRARVSRGLIGALEHGRHMPAADAAIRIAQALDTTVEGLFADADTRVTDDAVPVLGGSLTESAIVRTSRVGDQIVARIVDEVAAITGTAGAADGVVSGGRIKMFAQAAPAGAVVVGCDPLLGLAERLLDHTGQARLVWVPGTSGEAVKALEAGRCHAVLVHGPAGTLEPPPRHSRWHLTRWRSGFATHTSLRRPSLEALLGGEVQVTERDRSAACQQAVQRAARRLRVPRGPKPRRTAASHMEAARAALEHQGAAVSIEPVAVAMGLDFCELEVHDVELWVADAWSDLPGVRALLDLLSSARFHDRATALPAYDLTDTGQAR